jgi:hypothetical protein
MTKIKKMGARLSPCLTPLVERNCSRFFQTKLTASYIPMHLFFCSAHLAEHVPIRRPFLHKTESWTAPCFYAHKRFLEELFADTADCTITTLALVAVLETLTLTMNSHKTV